jgi:hypothetical protein
MSAKRTFLFRAFHPVGVMACNMAGLPPASGDVDTAEYLATQRTLDSIPEQVIEQTIEHARWMVEVLASDDWEVPIDPTGQVGSGQAVCPDCGAECEAITLEEILVKFYIAMRLEEARGQLVR